MKRYNPIEIEPKWQKIWHESDLYKAVEDNNKPKKYILEYFPYPSGAAMHVGHVRNYAIGDVISRFYRMNGYNVLHPMGWDAFGLPAENYAIKNNISPQIAIKENTEKFKRQLNRMGFSYDWSREINSSDPAYYKWTQWFFLLLFKKGLAYQQESLQWWCPTDKTVLANEQVEAGLCWRCGNKVEKKSLKQWFFKITDYADRLEADLDDINWSESIKSMQRNWIGRSKGAEIFFDIENLKQKITVFTTRPDTIFGATFLVIAPEHPLTGKLTLPEYKSEVDKYIKNAEAKSEIERQETNRDKTGVFTGSYAINPLTKQKMPIWVADYVLAGYGTGAIMAVPAHDERDFEFAENFKLPIVQVIEKPKDFTDVCYAGEGKLINSSQFDGQLSSQARETIVEELTKTKQAVEKINYKMRDWLISRQRYWGAPIPIIHCPKDGAVMVPDDQLPVLLPEMTSYEPSGDGRSPLARVDSFVNTKCPKCGGDAKRETDTMDGFACSSWYVMRFADPDNDKEAFSRQKVDFWLPVDDYIGGAEHAVMHLLYARFWTKVMYDEGLINFNEPFKTLRNQGMILAPDGQKMSKSKGNTIEPDSLIDDGYGADSIRLMELFIGPWNQSAAWSVEGMGGCYKFLQRVWNLVQEFLVANESSKTTKDNDLIDRSMHLAIKKVTRDLHELGFNTAIASLMEFVNVLYKVKVEDNYTSKNWPETLKTLILLLAPFAPHISEELWEQFGEKSSIHTQAWPEWEESKLQNDQVTVVVQINGKVRDQLTISLDSEEEKVLAMALKQEKVKAYVTKEPKKVIYVKGKLLSIVV